MGYHAGTVNSGLHKCVGIVLEEKQLYTDPIFGCTVAIIPVDFSRSCRHAALL